ncbi:MAG: hypothetical protein NT007_15430 [Candidatus Kapabacteria bacterium]|nr:hypothetical protein [Candidatus Kapabacteria bacterium]
MKILYCLLTISLIIFISCKDNVIGYKKSGNITGQIEFNLNEVNISINSLNLNTKTDSSGMFNFVEIKKGIYDIFFTKDGYDTSAIFGFNYLGDNIFINSESFFDNGITAPTKTNFAGCRLLHLYPKNLNSLNLDNIQKLNNDSLLIRVINNNLTTECYLFFFSKNKQLIKTDSNYFGIAQNSLINKNTIPINKSLLYHKGFNSGDSIYFFVCD